LAYLTYIQLLRDGGHLIGVSSNAAIVYCADDIMVALVKISRSLPHL